MNDLAFVGENELDSCLQCLLVLFDEMKSDHFGDVSSLPNTGIRNNHMKEFILEDFQAIFCRSNS